MVGVLAAAIAAGTLAVVAVIGQARPVPSPTPPALELTATVNVVVQLADGTTVRNPDGLLLPDGSTVSVGDGGSARIGGLVLAPGEVVTVHDGRAQVQQQAVATGGLSPAPPTGPPAASARTAPSAPPSTVLRSPATSAAPTPAPSAGAAASPAGPPVPTPTETSPAATPAPAASAMPSAQPIRAPKLGARLVAADTIAVAWTRTPGARTYVLVVARSKNGIAARPVYPGGRVLAQFTQPPAEPLRFVVAAGVVQVKLMVVALDLGGHELARSHVVRVDLPGAAAAAPSG